MGALAVIVTRRVRARQREVLVEQICTQMQHALKKRGLKQFDLESVTSDLAANAVVTREATSRLYAEMYVKAVADLVVTPKEGEILKILRSKLQISDATAEEIEQAVKQDRYRAELQHRLADGLLNETEAAELHRIRSSLGLSDEAAVDAARSDIVDAYRATFRRLVSDGVLDDKELAELQMFRDATGLSPTEASRVSASDALRLYRRTVSMICQDGEVTDDELAQLNRLRDVLDLDDAAIEPMRNQVARVRELGHIRSGKLPTIPTDARLRNSEICHYLSRCRFQWETATQTKHVTGTLMITNQRLIFNSESKSFEARINRILNVTTYSNGLDLGMTSNRGQGSYFVEDSELLEAVLEAVIAYHNRVISEKLDSAKTRHIPEHVRLEVWQRDGGKCCRCDATDYLEFDHIIPFSKGGSNSDKNVQLLCRRCNLAKSDEIV